MQSLNRVVMSTWRQGEKKAGRLQQCGQYERINSRGRNHTLTVSPEQGLVVCDTRLMG